jgi:hypothetical protein
MPVFECRDCAELHTLGRKRPRFTGYGTCACTCPMCGNEGRTVCENCGGTGKAGWFGQVCKKCKGERTLVCATCNGFLAHPTCPVCRGTSCETCSGSRRVDLKTILANLKPMPRRRIILRPAGSPAPNDAVDFPVFTYERVWKRLAGVVDLNRPLSVRSDSGWQCVHLSGKLIANDRADYWIYRVAENEYGIDERVSCREWEHSPTVAGVSL